MPPRRKTRTASITRTGRTSAAMTAGRLRRVGRSTHTKVWGIAALTGTSAQDGRKISRTQTRKEQDDVLETDALAPRRIRAVRRRIRAGACRPHALRRRPRGDAIAARRPGRSDDAMGDGCDGCDAVRWRGRRANREASPAAAVVRDEIRGRRRRAVLHLGRATEWVGRRTAAIRAAADRTCGGCREPGLARSGALGGGARRGRARLRRRVGRGRGLESRYRAFERCHHVGLEEGNLDGGGGALRRRRRARNSAPSALTGAP